MALLPRILDEVPGTSSGLLLLAAGELPFGELGGVSGLGACGVSGRGASWLVPFAWLIPLGRSLGSAGGETPPVPAVLGGVSGLGACGVSGRGASWLVPFAWLIPLGRLPIGVGLGTPPPGALGRVSGLGASRLVPFAWLGWLPIGTGGETPPAPDVLGRVSGLGASWLVPFAWLIPLGRLPGCAGPLHDLQYTPVFPLER